MSRLAGILCRFLRGVTARIRPASPPVQRAVQRAVQRVAHTLVQTVVPAVLAALAAGTAGCSAPRQASVDAGEPAGQPPGHPPRQPQAASSYGAAPAADTCRPYLFGWPFVAAQGMTPRGGTTRGAAVTLIEGPSENWTRLRASGPEAFRRDRAAILAMAGDYRASFDFLETAVFVPGRQASPSRPYRSWGTERIYVAADSGSFISLQHVMVMFFEDDGGKVSGPMVMKHWRQDWRFEPASLSEHRGRGLWVRRDLGPRERQGAWSQSVFHVDDSPRYASAGRWEHNASFSAWTGDQAWRPLPRREHTVRTDYHVLEGRNRHTILPTGWLHEQDNLKRVLDSAGRIDTAAPYLAREAGIDRYDLIRDFDFSAGDAYWKGTGPFWAKVRARWERLLGDSRRLRVSDSCRGEPVFAAFFGLADRTAGAAPPSPRQVDQSLDSLFACTVRDETSR